MRRNFVHRRIFHQDFTKDGSVARSSNPQKSFAPMNSDLPSSAFRLPPYLLSRRGLLSRLGMGFGAMALGKLMEETSASAASSVSGLAQNPLAVRTPHFAPKAKRVVHLFMNG